MAYTVKQISRLSGVSVRTLRWYDKIGLLKPAFIGENQYRYYQEAELLMLQQILFYRSLEFKLSDIKMILSSKQFNQSQALLEHRSELKKRLCQIEQLVKTIDSTLACLRGKKMMRHEDLYQGFQAWAKDKGDESFSIVDVKSLDECDDPNEKIVLMSTIGDDKTANWDVAMWEKHHKETCAILHEVAKCMKLDLEPICNQVQALIKKHCAYARQFHVMSQAVYLALSELYRYKKPFRAQLDPVHPQLHQYMSRAMKIYAYNNLITD